MPFDVSSQLWHDSVRVRAVSACAGARARQLLLPHLLPQLVLPPRRAGQSTPCQLLGADRKLSRCHVAGLLLVDTASASLDDLCQPSPSMGLLSSSGRACAP